MTSIEIFLDNAPKSLVNLIYQTYREQSSGLVSNTKIVSIVTENLKSIDHLEDRWKKLNDAQQKILINIYLSGKNGLSLADLTWCVSPAEQFLLKHTLNDLCWQLLIYRSEEDKTHYFGFSDYRPYVLDRLTFEEKAKGGMPKNYQHRLNLHLISVASFIYTHPMPISQNGEINRRFFSQMQNRLKLDHPLPEDVDSREEELQLLLTYLAKMKLAKQNGDQLNLVLESFVDLEKNRLPKPSDWIKQALIEWDEEAIITLQNKIKEPVSLECFSSQLASFTRYQNEKLEHWHNIAPLIKWLWWAGKIQLHLEEDRLTGISAAPAPHDVEMPLYFLPNFEVHLPMGSSFESCLLLEFTSECIREDQLCTYRLQSDSVHELLKAGFPTEKLKEGMFNFPLPPNVKEALQQWIFTHEGASLHDVYFLELEDPKILSDMVRMPQFSEWDLIEVPGKGIIVPKHLKVDVTEMVQTFGFYLRENTSKPNLKTFSLPNLKEERRTPQAIPNYLEKEPASFNLRIGELGKYGGGLQELEFNQRLRVIEYAILTDSRLEILQTETRSPFVLLPKELNTRTDPITIDGKHFPSGDFKSIPVEEIKKIRVVD